MRLFLYFLSLFSSSLIKIITVFLCHTHRFGLSSTFRPLSLLVFYQFYSSLKYFFHWYLSLFGLNGLLFFCSLFLGCPVLFPYDMNQPKGRVFSYTLQPCYTLFLSSAIYEASSLYIISFLWPVLSFSVAVFLLALRIS